MALDNRPFRFRQNIPNSSNIYINIAHKYINFEWKLEAIQIRRNSLVNEWQDCSECTNDAHIAHTYRIWLSAASAVQCC